MKKTWQQEHTRHHQSLVKLDEYIQLAYKQQKEARNRLCRMINVYGNRRAKRDDGGGSSVGGHGENLGVGNGFTAAQRAHQGGFCLP